MAFLSDPAGEMMEETSEGPATPRRGFWTVRIGQEETHRLGRDRRQEQGRGGLSPLAARSPPPARPPPRAIPAALVEGWNWAVGWGDCEACGQPSGLHLDDHGAIIPFSGLRCSGEKIQGRRSRDSDASSCETRAIALLGNRCRELGLIDERGRQHT